MKKTELFILITMSTIEDSNFGFSSIIGGRVKLVRICSTSDTPVEFPIHIMFLVNNFRDSFIFTLVCADLNDFSD